MGLGGYAAIIVIGAILLVLGFAANKIMYAKKSKEERMTECFERYEAQMDEFRKQ